MRIAESELIINGDGSVFHLHLRPEELADNVILVGDPGRVDMIAEYFEEKEFRHSSREFVSVTGKYKGVRMTALSTGIGTDNIDIVMNELDALANVDFETREVKPEHRTLNVIRIGTSGAIQPDIPLGAFVFSHISVGCDGLMNWYADRDKISMLDIEEAFKAHTGWNKHLPDPYFVRAGQEMIDRFNLNLFVKEIYYGFGGDREHLVIHAYANTVLASAHTEGATKLYLFAKIVFGDKILKTLNDTTRALDVTGTTYTYSNFHFFHHSFVNFGCILYINY